MKKFFSLFLLLFFVFALAGCATRSKLIEGTVKKFYEESVKPKNYDVVRGDTLWEISKSEYTTPWLWPMIYKDNRDTIKDPDIIEIGQKLIIKSVFKFNPDEVSVAIWQAQKTPPYKPHSKPRKIMPLKY